MFDESVVLFTRMYGWRGPCYVPASTAVRSSRHLGVRRCTCSWLNRRSFGTRNCTAYASRLLHAVIAGVQIVSTTTLPRSQAQRLYYRIGREPLIGSASGSAMRRERTGILNAGRESAPHGPVLRFD